MSLLICLVHVKRPCLQTYMLFYVQNHTAMFRPKGSPYFTNAEILILEEVETRKLKMLYSPDTTQLSKIRRKNGNGT